MALDKSETTTAAKGGGAGRELLRQKLDSLGEAA